VNTISGEMALTLGRPTATHEQQYQIASDLFGIERPKLKTLVDVDIPSVEKELERAGAPYTPGRVPEEDLQSSPR
jgi:esterase/lipase superfamily enzyme